MDLSLFVSAVQARQYAWSSGGAVSELRGPSGHTAKKSASVRVETSSTIAELVVWDSGEAEIIRIDLPDSEPVVEVCEVKSAASLNARLDDVEGYVGLRR